MSSYAQPVNFVVLNAPNLRSGPDSARLQTRVAALPGITACAIRPAQRLLAVAYNPARLSQQQLCRQLGVTVRPAAAPIAPAPSARQCPVPAGYLTALEKIRFFFNLRRLYVKV